MMDLERQLLAKGKIRELRELGIQRAEQVVATATSIKVLARVRILIDGVMSSNNNLVLSAVQELGALSQQHHDKAPTGMSGDESSTSGMGDMAAVNFGAITNNLFNAAVKEVKIKTQVTPEMTYAPGAPGEPAKVESDGGPGEFILKLMKPKVEIDTPAGKVEMAPYGEPTENYFWPFAAALGVGAAGLAWLAWRGLMSFGKKRS